MAKARSKLHTLPLRVVYGVYERMLNNVKLPAIVDWIFAQPNENEDGQPCAEVWNREAKSADAAQWNCQVGLYETFKSPEYLAWKRQYLVPP